MGKNEIIEKVAEQTGYETSVVRKIVTVTLQVLALADEKKILGNLRRIRGKLA